MSRQTMIPGPSTALLDGQARRKEYFGSRETEGWPNLSESDLDAATSGAMNRMIDHLVDRKAVLTKLFRTVDTDQSGEIDATELGNALNSLGLKLSHQELRAIMMRLDSDGNGSIDLQEFIEHFKAERARRFEGHVPELKAAKMQLVQKLRDHTASMVAQKDGLYITLTQIAYAAAAPAPAQPPLVRLSPPAHSCASARQWPAREHLRSCPLPAWPRGAAPS
eukprot:COSAG02_NODE_7334_length_3059_cov_2.657770_4_plen_222_part_00